MTSQLIRLVNTVVVRFDSKEQFLHKDRMYSLLPFLPFSASSLFLALFYPFPCSSSLFLALSHSSSLFLALSRSFSLFLPLLHSSLLSSTTPSLPHSLLLNAPFPLLSLTLFIHLSIRPSLPLSFLPSSPPSVDPSMPLSAILAKEKAAHDHKSLMSEAGLIYTLMEKTEKAR